MANSYSDAFDVQFDTKEMPSMKVLTEMINTRAEAMACRIYRLEKALEFYANPEVYKPHPHGPAFDRRDLSATAIAALKDCQPRLQEEMEATRDDVAVGIFASAMKGKLAASRAKGRSGWQWCATDDLWCMLREHVEKGDPRDIANIAMMIWHNERQSKP